MHGEFPDNIKEKFIQLLEYFGQSPIILRSSSLQEDNFGNAFAGKYESVFAQIKGQGKNVLTPLWMRYVEYMPVQ